MADGARPSASNLLRAAPHYRRDAFTAGLRRLGYQVREHVADPRPGDVLLVWNRYGGHGETADRWEQAGATVVVAENCPLGNDWLGDRSYDCLRFGSDFQRRRCYSLARSHVATCGGLFQRGGSQRWDGWKVEMWPMRDTGEGETVILGQRGIGEPGVRSPERWAERVRARVGGRIREHPGTAAVLALEQDLKMAREVVTWNSSAALRALMLGIPVWYGCAGWIGAPAARPLTEWPDKPLASDERRLQVMRDLAWAIWTIDEIESGDALRWVIGT